MAIKAAIFKIGGSILENSKYLINCIAQLTQLYEDNIIKKIILIPGGGLIANFVRKISLEFKFNEELAHWIAVYSMDFNGIRLNRKFPHLEIVDDFETIRKVNKTMLVFLPYKYLKIKDELPYSWDVTSDSITLYLAYKFNLEHCFLIKDVDGIVDIDHSIIKEISAQKFTKLKEQERLAIYQNSNQDLKVKSRPIDPYLVKLIDKYRIACTILNGASQDLMIFNYFRSDKNNNITYTEILPT